MPPPRRRPAVLIAACLAVCATLLAAAAPALAVRPPIHAHRGGPLEFGKPVYGENTLPAFKASALRGFVLEMDAKLTKDGVPVVIHDPLLDRTTPCTGQVSERTLADLRANCPSDIIGTDANFVQLGPNDRRRTRIPTLAEALALARFTRRAREPRDQEPAGRPGLRQHARVRERRARRGRALRPPALAADRPVLLVPEPRRDEAAAPRRGAEPPDSRRAQPGFCGPARRSLDLTAVAGAAPHSSPRRTGSACAWCPTRSTPPRRSRPRPPRAWTS